MEGLSLFGVDDYAKGAQILEADVKAASARVSPWLWIVSLLGFAGAIMNRYQIQQMFGNWKNARRVLGSK